MRMAFLGPQGTNAEEAARRYLGSNSSVLVPYETIFDSIKAVESQEVDKAIAPLENSIEGSVATTLDLLVSSDLVIEREVDLPISNHLMALPGITQNQFYAGHPNSRKLLQEEISR